MNRLLSPECEGLPLPYSGMPQESAEDSLPALLNHADVDENNLEQDAALRLGEIGRKLFVYYVASETVVAFAEPL